MMYIVVNNIQLNEYKNIVSNVLASGNIYEELYIVPLIQNFNNYIKEINAETRDRYILTGNWND